MVIGKRGRLSWNNSSSYNDRIFASVGIVIMILISVLIFFPADGDVVGDAITGMAVWPEVADFPDDLPVGWFWEKGDLKGYCF